MNTARIAALATLMLIGLAAAEATEVLPAWSEEGFVMEEVVVTAEASASFYMEEIVVTAPAPNHLYMEEIVVTATMPEAEARVAALEMPTTAQKPAPLMEEIVVVGWPEDLPTRIAARLRFLRNARRF